MKLHVVLEKQKEGGFVAYIPELPGCHTQGNSRAEALENIGEARELYLEVLKDKHGHSLPKVEVIPIPS
ncbi:MAG: type II toxin-antitoxin system HicB family antitoxin [Candidatus Micrarchaeota archaeon]